ncbi:TetR/AcrR family transcriptional regulator [Polynucleobacter sp. IMCC 30228]|uniref:TetR/AcrR family transcriptional regulator n=1 Tax=Polynucleobacter sp. IMCC 30228 TaxID=2781011 RepID=UPI001F307FB6|nr:TetR/AcrR family transcriptional regulator [Polynucleobacter sp. IMCC 30228]
MNKIMQIKQTAAKPNDKKLLLINIGTAIFTQKGFSITSLDEIVEIAEIPKGSFYYYFKSKDEFAIEVIKNYGIYFSKKLQRILSNDKKSPLERLKEFTKEAEAGVRRYEFKRGCLIGNLGQEMATLEERFRIELLNVIADWRDQVRQCIDLAKERREIKTTVDASELANFFWCAWEGAVLCSKLELSTQPLNIVSRLFITELLQPV